jgi:hypothetical protein
MREHNFGQGEEDGSNPSSWPDSAGPLHGALNAHGATGTLCHALEFGDGGGGGLWDVTWWRSLRAFCAVSGPQSAAFRV